MPSTKDLLTKAKRAIASGEASLRQAAELIAKAQAQGATQREIAKRIGKSAAWINRLLQWRKGGFRDTAFGPQSKAKRSRVQAPEQRQARAPSTAEQAQAQTARAEADKAKAEATKARATVIAAMFGGPITAGQRMLLLKGLEGLGARNADERASAALMVDKLRARLGFTWDDLIVPPRSATAERDAA